MGGLFSAGLELVFDAQQRFLRDGTEAFLRLQNFQSSGDFQEVGVPYAPTGTAAAQTGFTDILIDPPPSVTAVSTRDIGLSNGKLMFGAVNFLISNTFVFNMQELYPNVKDAYDVFRNWDGQTPVIGIVYNYRMHSIEDINRRVVGNAVISWKLTCNAMETAMATAAQETDTP